MRKIFCLLAVLLTASVLSGCVFDPGGREHHQHYNRY
jgi:hypothetical protein